MTKSRLTELREIRKDIKSLLAAQAATLERVNNIRDWTETHQDMDTVALGLINKRINGLYTFASSVAVIAFFIGKYVEF